MLLFALGGVLFAFLPGYLDTGDKAAGVFAFVAITAVRIRAVVYFLGPQPH